MSQIYAVVTERCGVYTPHFYDSLLDAKEYALSTPYDWALHLAEWSNEGLRAINPPLLEPVWEDDEDAAAFDRLIQEREEVAA